MSLTINSGTIIDGHGNKGFTLNSQPIIPISASFTISDADFSASAYQGPGITDFGGSIGFISDGANNLTNANYGITLSNITPLKAAEILAFYTTHSLMLATGYNFSVAGTGGASNITKVVLGRDSYNLIIAPADPTDTDFTTDAGLLVNIVNANGILAFPVTFTLDSPLITHPADWY